MTLRSCRHDGHDTPSLTNKAHFQSDVKTGVVQNKNKISARFSGLKVFKS
jgi:hypothetical protein